MVNMPHALQMLRHCGCSHRMLRKMSRTLSSGFFSTRRRPDSPAEQERIRFWSASHGGKAEALRSSSYSCAEYSEERSLLAALAERLAERPVLVTFNGKSFDWPLLETRYRMTRTILRQSPRAHLDFLHPARNLWRLRLGSVRLSQLERHVLGWDRGADLVSDLIPRIYLDFVRGGHAEPLVPVFQHNQMDLRGLAGLAGRILSLLGDDDGTCQDGLELYGVSRICERRGEVKRARKLYEQSIGSALPMETDRAARVALARLAKRDGDLARARELWESALGNSREGYQAYEQLAIYVRARGPRAATGVYDLHVRRSPNFIGQTKQGRSRQPHIAGPRRGLSIGLCASNARPAGRCLIHLTHSNLGHEGVHRNSELQ